MAQFSVKQSACYWRDRGGFGSLSGWEKLLEQYLSNILSSMETRSKADAAMLNSTPKA
ncbi:hypothetical protein ACQ4M4_20165 [Leptolyngbya sp. AN02str]|uniref:hypothetical protein n=1 Tax=Leptolyngbya sp. AN02str TaxID=3423363 RepID=UPI003D3136F4